ncbi:Chanoclavine-I aldehyde reductase [Penicillium chermesinum]|uniref:chanoclavine-I aldehyde reductase n=1 Tax=Penicillium chermesinum TaxID=63820 RepID=A0A9W9TN64_9EURO|nr:Chanoclavine-I aldehyde reductase [Penicillium chermesinum]KAJ5232268.1 Chanoclavine-I aldehyde reductase [Penicillium chermesinum]KAJ6171922.1 Chanoclavine-I aldehyde reductase [Penicillium chermesinum]
MSKLFQPLHVGRTQLSHRITLAPLTRFRADDNHVPLSYVKDYYAQRGSTPGTLLISEATLISPRAGGYNNVPGLWSDAQISGWKEVTSAVHAKGSYIFAQLWALGRVADPAILASEGLDLVSASDIPVSGSPKPHPLTEAEIEAFIADYAQAARNAIEAGFDGVEIHGANGYLIDQFIQDVSNQRADKWGGSIENRSRFLLEVVRAVSGAIGTDRTGLRLSPFSHFQEMGMEDPLPQFTHIAKALAPFKLAYAHLVEPRVDGNTDADTDTKNDLRFFLEAYARASPVILAGGYTPELARQSADVTYKDYDVLVAFGRSFISNPDLPFRVRENIAFSPYDRDTFYVPKSPKGYIDYEFSAEFKASTVDGLA